MFERQLALCYPHKTSQPRFGREKVVEAIVLPARVNIVSDGQQMARSVVEKIILLFRKVAALDGQLFQLLHPFPGPARPPADLLFKSGVGRRDGFPCKRQLPERAIDVQFLPQTGIDCRWEFRGNPGRQKTEFLTQGDAVPLKGIEPPRSFGISYVFCQLTQHLYTDDDDANVFKSRHQSGRRLFELPQG